MTEVRWSAFSAYDPWYPIATDQTTLLPEWAAVPENGTDTARKVCSDYFSDRNIWDEHFGADEDGAEMHVEIWIPDEIAGIYEVALERVVRGWASRLVQDPRSPVAAAPDKADSCDKPT